MGVVWCLSSIQNLVEKSLILPKIDAFCSRRSFDNVMGINFRFRSFINGHLRKVLMLLRSKFGANIFVKSGNIDMSGNSLWRPPPSSIFRVSKIFTFRHADGLVCELCTTFCSNVSYPKDRRTFRPMFPTFVWWWPFVPNMVQMSLSITKVLY